MQAFTLAGELGRPAGQRISPRRLRMRTPAAICGGPWSGRLRSVDLLAAGRDARGGCGACLLAAAPWFRGTFGSLADQFHAHQAGDELLCPDTVEINRRTFDIGFSHDPKPVLIMLDALTFGKNLHNCLLICFSNFGAIPERSESVASRVGRTDPRFSD